MLRFVVLQTAFCKPGGILMADFTTHLTTAMAISNDEREFFVALGTRIAELRKTRSVTQTQLTQALDVSQQTIQAYEVGRRRIQVSARPGSPPRASAARRRSCNNRSDASANCRSPSRILC